MRERTAFRLLRAELNDDPGKSLDVDFAREPVTGSWTTLLTGRNGSGKSRLLSAIAMAFDSLDRERAPAKVHHFALQYLLDGRDCSIGIHSGRITGYLDGREVQLQELPRPRSVAVTTASAFDKFRLPRDFGPFGDRAPSPALYKYLGIRDARGRVSANAAIHRALEHIFDTSDKDASRRARVAEVFEYLGYQPAVEVVYRWTFRGQQLFDARSSRVDPNDVERILIDAANTAASGIRGSIPQYLVGDKNIARELAASVDELRDLGEGRTFRIRADFSGAEEGREEQLRMARQLTRAGFAQMADVVLWREPFGYPVEISDASSGELSLVITVLGLASSIEDASLVLIDEPEINLHPQWQVEYLPRLNRVFRAYQGCHFVVATHSPTLVAGADMETTSVVDLERAGDSSNEAHRGRSVDEVLVRDFGVAWDSNLYIRHLLVQALRLVADRDTRGGQFAGVLTELNQAKASLPANSRVREVVDELGVVEREGPGR